MRALRLLLTTLGVTLVACGGGSVPAPAPPAVPAVPGAPLFEPLPEPAAGEWRARFDEPHVTFEEYVAGDPVRATDERRVLAFVAAGPFEPVEDAVMQATVRFCGIWFDLPTRQLAPLAGPPDDDGLVRTVRNPYTSESEPQIHTAWFLRQQLPRRLPDDAVVLTAVTMSDLYPGEGWNYVFGQALLRGRVGVYSLRRHFPEFRGEPDTQEARVLALRRSLKLVTHEVGHTFGLEHCVRFRCTMNGSNSLAESDRAPLHLCPDCLEKLRWNRGFDVQERYARLEEFFTTHRLDDEADWVRRRIAQARR